MKWFKAICQSNFSRVGTIRSASKATFLLILIFSLIPGCSKRTETVAEPSSNQKAAILAATAVFVLPAVMDASQNQYMGDPRVEYVQVSEDGDMSRYYKLNDGEAFSDNIMNGAKIAKSIADTGIFGSETKGRFSDADKQGEEIKDGFKKLLGVKRSTYRDGFNVNFKVVDNETGEAIPGCFARVHSYSFGPMPLMPSGPSMAGKAVDKFKGNSHGLVKGLTKYGLTDSVFVYKRGYRPWAMVKTTDPKSNLPEVENIDTVRLVRVTKDDDKGDLSEEQIIAMKEFEDDGVVGEAGKQTKTFFIAPAATAHTNVVSVGLSESQAAHLERGIAAVAHTDEIVDECEAKIRAGIYDEPVKRLKSIVEDKSLNPFSRPRILNVLVDGLIKMKNWPEANLYQTWLLLLPLGHDAYLREAGILRSIVHEYIQSGGTNPRLMTLELQITDQDLQNQIEYCKKQGYTPRAAALEMGDFYRRRMHLEKAEEEYKKGLSLPVMARRVPESLYGGLIRWTRTVEDTSDTPFLVGLRTIYTFEGRQTDLTKVQEQMSNPDVVTIR